MTELPEGFIPHDDHICPVEVDVLVSYITRFEDALAEEARRKGLHGVICGHIHKPEIRDINGILYCNDGDWVESLSALVEDAAGELSIVTWHDVVYQQLPKDPESGAPAPVSEGIIV